MAAAVFTLNSYTKMVIEMKHHARIRLEEAAGHAPPYGDIILAGGNTSLYSINLPLQHCQQGKLIDTTWPSRKECLPGVMIEGINSKGLGMLGGCGMQGCEDCERELDVLEKEGIEQDEEIC